MHHLAVVVVSLLLKSVQSSLDEEKRKRTKGRRPLNFRIRGYVNLEFSRVFSLFWKSRREMSEKITDEGAR